MRFIQTFISHLVIYFHTIFFLLNMTSGTHNTIRQHFMFVNNFQLRDLVVLQELVRQRISNPAHIRGLSDVLVEIDIIVCCRETTGCFRSLSAFFSYPTRKEFPEYHPRRKRRSPSRKPANARDGDDLHLSPSTLK